MTGYAQMVAQYHTFLHFVTLISLRPPLYLRIHTVATIMRSGA